MPSFQRLEMLGLEPTCNGGAPTGANSTIVDASAITFEETVRGMEKVTFNCPITSRSLPRIVEGAVVRAATEDPEVFDEFRISDVTRSSRDPQTPVQVTARSLVYDLADLGRMRTLTLGGRAQWGFAATDMTGAQLWSTFIAPWLVSQGRGWIQLGTVDFATQLVSMAWDGETAQDLLDRYLREPIIQGELAWRRDGTTRYLVDLVKQVGAGAPVRDVRDRKNLLSCVYVRSRVEQSTVVEPILAGGASIEDHAWRVASVDAGTETLFLDDPAGGPGPFTEDHQANGLWLFRPSVRGASSEWAQVVDSTAGQSPSVQLAARASQFVAGQMIQFRRTPGLSERLDPQRLESLRPLRITGVTPGTRSVTVEHPWAAAVTPIPFDDELLGWTARLLRFAAASPLAEFDPALRRIRVASTASWVVGQFLVCTASASSPAVGQPWTLYPNASRLLRITQIVSGDTVEVENPFSDAPPFTATGTTGVGYAWVFTVPGSAFVEDGTSGTSTYVLSSVALAAVGDLLVLSQTFDGLTVQELTSPQMLAKHGRISKTLPREQLPAEWMVTPNAGMRTWSAGPNAPPDGFAVSAAKVNGLQESVQRVTGPYSVALRHRSSGFVSGGSGGVGATSCVLSAADNWRIGDIAVFGSGGQQETRTLTGVSADGLTLSWVGGFSFDHGVVLQNGVVEQGAGGTPTLEVPRLWAPSVIGADRWMLLANIKLVGASAGAVVTFRFRAEDWDTSNQEVTDVSTTGLLNGAWRTVAVSLQAAPGAQLRGTAELNAKANWPHGASCYIDLLGFVRTNVSDVPALVEYSAATKGWQEGALQLLRAAVPPTTIEIDAIDLPALDAERFAGAEMTVGGYLRVQSHVLPEDLFPRLIGRTRVVGQPEATRFTLDTAQLDLVDLLRSIA